VDALSSTSINSAVLKLLHVDIRNDDAKRHTLHTNINKKLK
jgi:hypothetical protein